MLLVFSLFMQAGTGTSVTAPSITIDKPVLVATGVGRSTLSVDVSEYTVILYADVEDEDETAAAKAAERLRKEIIRAVKEAGGTEGDVVLTSSNTSAPIEGDPYFRITQDIKVMLRKVKDLDKAKEKFLLLSGVQLGSVTPTIEETADYMPAIAEARKTAVKNARDEASGLAAETGVMLGEPVYIGESIGYPYYSGYEAAASEVTVTVTIYYGIHYRR
jgi:uncharacterized protein YggE